jgi:hypothetical protein
VRAHDSASVYKNSDKTALRSAAGRVVGVVRATISAVLCVLATVLIAGIALAQGAAPASPVAPTEVVSPLPGTPDANPATQISFLGAPASRLRDIVVKGSRTGPHAGRLVYYPIHTGGSYVPSRAFAPGERVTVTADVVGYGAVRHVGTTFTVSSPYRLPGSEATTAAAAGALTVMRFHSRPDLEPTAVRVTTPPANPGLGDVFISPDAGVGQTGPMIVAPNGQLVWFKPLGRGIDAFDLNVQLYQGAPVLTWWQGQIIGGHGQGADVIDNSHYQQIATVHAGNGLYADLHDFQITAQGTAWITAFAPVRWDLSSVGGPKNGVVDDCVVQEVDIKTGLVMFEWHALGHLHLSDSYQRVSRSSDSQFDYFHINSLDPLPTGDLLISARNTWATYLVSETNGSVIWQLGGKRSTFKLGPGVSFAWQHDAQLLPDGSISLFDNDDSPAEASQSAALDIALNTSSYTATLLHRYTYPGKGILSPSQGDVQQLSNGDAFVGWGQAGEISEFSPTGHLTFDMQIAAPANSYRAYRYTWSAKPATQPALVPAVTGGKRVLYASWNGATDVARWRVLAGTSSTTLAVVGSYPLTGFETAVPAPSPESYVRIQALSGTGAVLSSSSVVKS